MSGNRTYIGPFGRVLPVPEGHEEPEKILGPVDETRSSTMAMYTLPRPALDFGSDNRGFTDPLRYSSQKGALTSAKWHERSNATGEQPRTISHELLPGVDQLLTPATHSRVPPLPYPPQQSPEERSSLSTGLVQAAELPRRDASQAYPANYQSRQTPSLPQFPQEPTLQKDSNAGSHPMAPTQAFTHHTAQMSAPYPVYPGQTHQVSYLAQGPPQPMAPVGYPSQLQQPQDSVPSGAPLPQQAIHQASPPQYYPNDPSTYSAPSKQAGSPEQSEKSTDNPVKPLPRVVREAVLPGEGPVWVYEDGSTCPKVIDGEPVNAEWGVTKAGKPRKRLAIACTTCREKKIKCQPALPKCAQCDKFGRECHYTTAPRIQQATPETPSYEFQARHKPVTIKTESHNRALLPATAKSPEHAEHLHVKLCHPSLENKNVRPVRDPKAQKQPKKPPFKKQRSCRLPVVQDMDRCATANKKVMEYSSLPIVKAPCEDEISKVTLPGYNWSKNPYEIDAQTTRHYMEMYFVHVNAAVYWLFPRKPFFRWLENGDDKSLDDLLLIYSMLALGSSFSARHDCQTDGRIFVGIARYAIYKSQHKYSLQLVQSRILLGLYYFATEESEIGWDFVGQGLRAASGLQLNIEEHCREVRDGEDELIGLQRHALIECRRRTYWSAYIIDRLLGFHSGHLPMLQSQDTFLRLPCDEDTYCQQKPSDAPFLNNGLHKANLAKMPQPTALSPMAYLVNISAIWGDILTYNHRHAREPAGEHASNYEKYYRETIRRVADWKTGLPKEIEYTPSNASSSIEKGIIGIFLEMHTLYHANIIKLNRNLRHDVISPLSNSRNFKKARKQALELLKMMEVVAFASRSSKNALDTSGNFPEFSDETLESCSPLAGSTPFAGHAALLAIDILSAGGSLDPEPFKNLVQSMTAGLAIVDELSQCWSSAVGQKKVILRRLESLSALATSDAAGVKKVWRCKRALDPAFQSGQDVFYPYGENVQDTFFDYLEIDIKEDDVIYIG